MTSLARRTHDAPRVHDDEIQHHLAAMITRRFHQGVISRAFPLFLLVMSWGARASVAADAPADTGVYTSAIFQSEAAMLQAQHASGHGCVWKGRAKKKGKVICKGGMQLKCGRGGWYRIGPCQAEPARDPGA